MVFTKAHELAGPELPVKTFPSPRPFVRPPQVSVQPTVPTGLWQLRIPPAVKVSVHTHPRVKCSLALPYPPEDINRNETRRSC